MQVGLEEFFVGYGSLFSDLQDDHEFFLKKSQKRTIASGVQALNSPCILSGQCIGSVDKSCGILPDSSFTSVAERTLEPQERINNAERTQEPQENKNSAERTQEPQEVEKRGEDARTSRKGGEDARTSSRIWAIRSRTRRNF